MKSFILGILSLALLAAASAAAAEVIHVDVDNIAYSPAKISAHVGDTVEWANKDFVTHTATTRDKSWDVLLPAHKTGSVVLKNAGHIDYYCKYHPTMKGEIDVGP